MDILVSQHNDHIDIKINGHYFKTVDNLPMANMAFHEWERRYLVTT